MNHYFFMLVLFWVCKIQVSSPLESWTQCSSFACVTTTFCFWHSISAVCNILHISVTRNLTWGLSSSSYGLDIIDCLAFDSPLRQLYQLTLWTEGSSLQHNNKFLPSRQKKKKKMDHLKQVSSWITYWNLRLRWRRIVGPICHKLNNKIIKHF